MSDVGYTDQLAAELRDAHQMIEELAETLIMVRDADEDCKLDGLQTIQPLARARIDNAIRQAKERWL